ncbi:MAG TPA: chemotaxis protein CheW [Acholeplasmataceae bacterium]|nr:chemotaxis protein CheW [Acholeplasmataceae bacterium]
MDTKIKDNDENLEVKLLNIEIGGTLFCLPLEIVDEVFPTMDAFPISHIDSSIDGIVIPRDFVLTVVDLAKLLDLPHNIIQERIVSITYGKNKVGLRVDDISGITSSTIHKDLFETEDDKKFEDTKKDVKGNKKVSKKSNKKEDLKSKDEENINSEKINIDIEFDERYQDKNYYKKYEDIVAGYSIINKRQIIVLDHIKIIKKLMK